jgi:hypothetical protein
MAKKAKLGDVGEIVTPAGLAYVQYTHIGSHGVPLVRVLPGLYESRPDIEALARERELYFAFYGIDNALRNGQIQIAANEPIPEWARPFPVMRHWTLDNSWLIGDGYEGMTRENIRRMLKVRDLTPEQKKLSTADICPHVVMVKDLARGWTPERAEEFNRLDALESKARKEAEQNLGHSKPGSLDHYLYFPKKSDAQKAATRLREKGWTVEVRKGGDGENWLTLAKQPAPIEEDIGEIREELERLADDLGGEYDGWGAAVWSGHKAKAPLLAWPRKNLKSVKFTRFRRQWDWRMCNIPTPRPIWESSYACYPDSMLNVQTWQA